MHNGKYVLSPFLDFIDKDVFLRISNKYNGNRHVKDFHCWNQLAVMVFGQLSNRESLRDVVLATQAHASKAFHLGFGKYATRGNLSKANANRDYRIFEEFAYRVVDEARRVQSRGHLQVGRLSIAEGLDAEGQVSAKVPDDGELLPERVR